MLIFKVATKAIGVNYASFLGENSVLGKIVKSVKLLKSSNNLPETQA